MAAKGLAARKHELGEFGGRNFSGMPPWRLLLDPQRSFRIADHTRSRDIGAEALSREPGLVQSGRQRLDLFETDAARFALAGPSNREVQ